MLRLEKPSRNRPVTVIFRRKKSLFSPTFLQAFACAAAFHLLGFTLFQVSPIKIRQVETIFPPIQVNADFDPVLDGAVLAELEHSHSPKIAIEELKPSVPQFPLLRPRAASRGAALPEPAHPSAFPFATLHTRPAIAALFPLYAPAVNAPPPFEMILTGPLAKLQIVDPGWRLQELSAKIPSGSHVHTLRYAVKVELPAGKIFWAHAATHAADPQLAALAQTILENMQFKKEPAGFIASGEIEMAFATPREPTK